MMLLEFRMGDRSPVNVERTGAPFTSAEPRARSPIVLYDGVCGLCNRSVQFVLKHDQEGNFRFASLQSPLASRILAQHGRDATDLDTVYVVLNCDPSAANNDQEELLARSDAVIYVLRRLGGFWGAMGGLLRLIPRPVCNWGYRVVARIRYRVFGKYDTCPLPSRETRERFLDL